MWSRFSPSITCVPTIPADSAWCRASHKERIMNSVPEHLGTVYDTFSTAAAAIYPVGFNPTAGITAGQLRLGTRIKTRDGRVFHFARMGAVAGVAGSLY